MTQADKARRFHELHQGERPLLLPNAWDAASARIVEQAGAAAIATTSSAMAWSLGYPGGEDTPLEDFLAACARICRVVSAPVTVDIEQGLGRSAADVAAVADRLMAFGAIGVNIEDGTSPGTSALAEPAVLCERIRAIRAVAEQRGLQFFINARTDTYFVPNDDPVARFEDSVRRALLYVEAGADGIFMPGLTDTGEIARMVRRLPRPLNIYAGYAGVPAVAELARAGARRVSVGCGPLQAALAQTRRMARELLEQGSYAAMTGEMLPAREAMGLFARP